MKNRQEAVQVLLNTYMDRFYEKLGVCMSKKIKAHKKEKNVRLTLEKAVGGARAFGPEIADKAAISQAESLMQDPKTYGARKPGNVDYL